MTKKFTVKQKKCIDLLAMGGFTQVEIGTQLNVNHHTVTRWKKLPGFMEAVLRRAVKLLKMDVPDVYKALSDKSKLGSDRHIKIFLDHLEKLEEVNAGKTSVTFTWQPPTQTGEKDNDE